MRDAGVEPGFSEGGGRANMGGGRVQEWGGCGRGEGAGEGRVREWGGCRRGEGVGEGRVWESAGEGVCFLPRKARKLLPL